MEILQKLNNLVDPQDGTAPDFENVSEAVRDLLLEGFQLHEFRKVMNDPAKKAEFLHKLKFVFKKQTMQKTIDTMAPDELDALSMMVTLAKNRQAHQQVLNFR